MSEESELHASLRARHELLLQLHATTEAQLAFEQDRLHAVFDASSEGLVVVGDDGHVTAANAEATRLLGPSDQLLGGPLAALLMAGSTEQSASRVLEDGWLDAAMFQRRRTFDNLLVWPKDQRSFTADCAIVPFRGREVVDQATGETSAVERRRGAVLVIASRSGSDETREQSQWQATHDALTGLGNRALLTDRVQHALLLAGRSGSWPAVMLLDLDSFKSVNDQLGHATGDRLLVEAGERIEREIRNVDTIARLGGDEFVVLCEALESADVVEQLAARILHSLEEPFDFNGERVQISASIGIARADAATETPDELFVQADLAMYRAKESGRNRIENFDPIMRRSTHRRIDMERALRQALDNDELTVVYQPIFNTQPGSLMSFETLVRWHHPELGSVSPIEFIPLAEEVGLIAALGERVLDIACRDAWTWRDVAHFDIGVHVNVSGRQLAASNFVNYLSRVLRHHHIEPSSVTLELTESVLLDNPERAAARLMALRDLGVRIAIDDFGVGYSSLAYLRRFPIDVLKVDRQFVSGVAQSPEGQDILRTMVELASGLDYVVVAQGVEQPEELALLCDLGFQFAQGFLLAAPMPPTEALLLAAASAVPMQIDADNH